MSQTIDAPATAVAGDVIYFAAGCFWGAEEYFSHIPGVVHTDVGYANGIEPHPSYEAVCTGRTHAAETVRVVYDHAIVSTAALITGFFRIVDPTTLNRQGPDVGTQYRSGIYYTDDDQRTVIEELMAIEAPRHEQPLVVEVQPIDSYYLAEEIHQKYLQKNPFGYCHIDQKHFIDVKKNGAPRVNLSSLSPERYHRPTDQALKRKLSPLAWRITQDSATEGPFSHSFWEGNPQAGIYVDVATGEPLFATSNQYNAGCGWPSFTQPIAPEVITTHVDCSLGMVRTEVRSRVGDSHLGHVFDDGPQETGGLRYCINGAALLFIPKKDMAAQGYGDLLDLFD